MKRLKIDLESERLFNRLTKRGYVIGNGAETRRIARALKSAKIGGVHDGYDPDTKKVILAMERGIKAMPRVVTPKSIIYDIET